MSRARRLFDLAGAAAGLLVFALPMACVAAAILLVDGRPVLFRQRRLGRHRREFEILKFRTMRDGVVTTPGRLLRATGLDEVPQLINILRGEMSGVGPRPLTAADVDRLGWAGPEVDFRWRCKPGLTGLAQLLGATAGHSGGRHSEVLRLDRVHAAEQWNPSLDCHLIAWSFAVNVFGKRRVRAWLRRRYRELIARPAVPAP